MKAEEALKLIENCVKEEIEFMNIEGYPEDPEIRKAAIKQIKKAWKYVKSSVRDYEKSWG